MIYKTKILIFSLFLLANASYANWFNFDTDKQYNSSISLQGQLDELLKYNGQSCNDVRDNIQHSVKIYNTKNGVKLVLKLDNQNAEKTSIKVIVALKSSKVDYKKYVFDLDVPSSGITLTKLYDIKGRDVELDLKIHNKGEWIDEWLYDKAKTTDTIQSYHSYLATDGCIYNLSSVQQRIKQLFTQQTLQEAVNISNVANRIVALENI